MERYSPIDEAEKIRTIIANFNFPHVKQITCSFGVTEYKKGDTKHSLLSRADKALYISKENGRNQVSVI
jgi:PleD family two-component response regulator